jgi:hypothetical protein
VKKTTTGKVLAGCVIDVLWTDKLWTFESILCRCLQSESYTKIHLPGPHCEFMHEFWALFCTCRPLTCIGATSINTSPLFHNKLPNPTPWCLLPSPNFAWNHGFIV